MTPDSEGAEGIEAIAAIHELLAGIGLLIGAFQMLFIFMKIVGFLTLAGGAAAGIGKMSLAYRMGAAEPLMNKGPDAGLGFTGLLVFAAVELASYALIIGALHTSSRGLSERYAGGWYIAAGIYLYTLIFSGSIILQLVSIIVLYILWNEKQTIDFSPEPEEEFQRMKELVKEDVRHFRNDEIEKIVPDPDEN